MRWWIVLAAAFGFIVILLQIYRSDVALFNHENHAARVVSHVCASLAAKQLSRAQLCEEPIPSIGFFAQRYRAQLEQNQQWYQERGWKFYPSVDCTLSEPIYSFMDRDFVCREGQAALIRDREAEIAANSEAQSCFNEDPNKKIRTVARVTEDGTLVLENKERVILAGVAFPGEATNTPAGAQCGDSVRYVKSQLEGQSVYINAEAGAERDEQFRLPVYLVTFRGEFFNREIVRLGLAKTVHAAEGAPKASCFADFFALEKLARSKKLGLWGTECLR